MDIKELIKVTENKGKQVVSARELHRFLRSERDFSTWIKDRILKYGFEENVDYSTFHKFVERGAGNLKSRLTEYAISLNMAKELAMIENTEKGRQIRKYFIKCEENLIEAVKQNMVPKEMYLDATAELDVLKDVNEKLTHDYNDIKLMCMNCTNEVAEFVNDMVIYKDGCSIRCDTVYEHYIKWCRRIHHYEPYKKKQFEELLLERMVEGHSIRKSDNHYLGIAISKER